MVLAPFQDRAASPPAELMQPLCPRELSTGNAAPTPCVCVCAVCSCRLWAELCGSARVVSLPRASSAPPLASRGSSYPAQPCGVPGPPPVPVLGAACVTALLQSCWGSRGVREVQNNPWVALIPSHKASDLENFRIMQTFCWKTLIHHNLDFQAESTCV